MPHPKQIVKSIFDRPELRGSLNRRSSSPPAEERVVRLDSRQKASSRFARGSSSLSSSSRFGSNAAAAAAAAAAVSLKERLRRISNESLARSPRVGRSDSSSRDGMARGRGRPSPARHETRRSLSPDRRPQPRARSSDRCSDRTRVKDRLGARQEARSWDRVSPGAQDFRPRERVRSSVRQRNDEDKRSSLDDGRRRTMRRRSRASTERQLLGSRRQTDRRSPDDRRRLSDRRFDHSGDPERLEDKPEASETPTHPAAPSLAAPVLSSADIATIASSLATAVANYYLMSTKNMQSLQQVGAAPAESSSIDNGAKINSFVAGAAFPKTPNILPFPAPPSSSLEDASNVAGTATAKTYLGKIYGEQSQKPVRNPLEGATTASFNVNGGSVVKPFCNVCKMRLNSSSQYEAHVMGRKHAERLMIQDEEGKGLCGDKENRSSRRGDSTRDRSGARDSRTVGRRDSSYERLEKRGSRERSPSHGPPIGHREKFNQWKERNKRREASSEDRATRSSGAEKRRLEDGVVVDFGSRKKRLRSEGDRQSGSDGRLNDLLMEKLAEEEKRGEMEMGQSPPIKTEPRSSDEDDEEMEFGPRELPPDLVTEASKSADAPDTATAASDKRVLSQEIKTVGANGKIVYAGAKGLFTKKSIADLHLSSIGKSRMRSDYSDDMEEVEPPFPRDSGTGTTLGDSDHSEMEEGQIRDDGTDSLSNTDARKTTASQSPARIAKSSSGDSCVLEKGLHPKLQEHGSAERFAKPLETSLMSFYKQKVCNHWEKYNKCPYGTLCHFLHPQGEKRKQYRWKDERFQDLRFKIRRREVNKERRAQGVRNISRRLVLKAKLFGHRNNLSNGQNHFANDHDDDNNDNNDENNDNNDDPLRRSRNIILMEERNGGEKASGHATENAPSHAHSPIRDRKNPKTIERPAWMGKARGQSRRASWKSGEDCNDADVEDDVEEEAEKAMETVETHNAENLESPVENGENAAEEVGAKQDEQLEPAPNSAEDPPISAEPIQVVITAKRSNKGKNPLASQPRPVCSNGVSGLTAAAVPNVTCFHCGRNGHKVVECRCLPVPGEHEGFIYFHSPVNKNRVKCRVCEIVLRNSGLIDAHAKGEMHQHRLVEFKRRKISLEEMLEREAAKI